MWIKGIFLMLFLSLYLLGSAQSDSSTVYTQSIQKVETVAPVDFRVPPKEKIKEYQQDSRFNYKKVERKVTLWDRIKYWFWEMVGDIINITTKSGVPSVVVIVIIVIVLCLIIMRVAGVDYRVILGKKKMDTQEVDIYTENVHEMDFDTLISNALRNKDFRLAIRFLYLKNLKLLSDRDIIDWNPNKTNYSYQYEIRSNTLRSKFLDTTLIFDYIWYGEFPVDEPKFTEVHARMNDFNKMITDER